MRNSEFKFSNPCVVNFERDFRAMPTLRFVFVYNFDLKLSATKTRVIQYNTVEALSRPWVVLFLASSSDTHSHARTRCRQALHTASLVCASVLAWFTHYGIERRGREVSLGSLRQPEE